MKDYANVLLGNYLRYLKLILSFGDLVLLNSAYLFAVWIWDGGTTVYHTKDIQILLFVTNAFWLFLIYQFNSFAFSRIKRIEENLADSLKLVFYLFIFLISFISLFEIKFISKNEFVTFFFLFLGFTMAYRTATIMMLKYLRKSGKNYKNVVIVGAGEIGLEIYNNLVNDLSKGYKILGYFTDTPDRAILPSSFLGNIRNLEYYALHNTVHEIYIALKEYDSQVIKQLIKFCEQNMIRLKFIPDYKLFRETHNVAIEYYGKVPIVSLRREPLEIPLNRLKKRAFDIVFSLSVILLVFPWLFPVLIILVKLSSRGPIFFSQKRSGEGNKYFHCWKFRTMRVNHLSDTKQATSDDDRITKIGKFLRQTSLDEMPQFFNVLIGNMSVVGPRPHMLKHTKEYSALIDNYLVRHYTKPGITGWAQTNGYRGETKDVETMAKRIEHDIWYIENWSFFLEFKIIYFTIRDMVLEINNVLMRRRFAGHSLRKARVVTEKGSHVRKPYRLVQNIKIRSRKNTLRTKRAISGS